MEKIERERERERVRVKDKERENNSESYLKGMRKDKRKRAYKERTKMRKGESGITREKVAKSREKESRSEEENPKVDFAE